MNNEKVYVNSIWVDEKVFSDGGSILKLTIKVDELIDFLNKNKGQNGKVRLNISKKKNAPKDDNGSTHYTVLDTWQPPVSQARTPQPAAVKPKPAPQKRQAPTDDDRGF